MEFLNPAALFGLLALPLLLLPYLIRRRPRRLMFSSLLLLMDAGEQPTSRPWGKLRLPWIFFLQLLLLALLIGALSEPVFSVRPSNVAIVLDNSASMQSREGNKTRFALAQAKARELSADLGVTGTIDLYLTTPRLEKARAKPLTSAEAQALISALEPYDLGDPPLDYDQVLNQMARERKYQRVYFITDHPARGLGGTVRIVTIGAPQANFAVTGFEVRRSSLTDARLEANVEVANFSTKDEKLTVSIRSSSAPVASRELIVGAGKNTTTEFTGLPDQAYYQAEIENRDALTVDNRRFAVPPSSRNLRILGVSPRPKELASLKSIPGVELDIIAPNDYEKTDRSSYGLEIFHYSAPEEPPQNPALFILPPAGNPWVDLSAPMGNATVSSWREPHSLTRYVNFNLFRPVYARPLKPRSTGEVVIESPGGVLAFATERQGVRFLILGFEPLPYLGRENLPMSIFTLNILDWFFENGIKSQATGEPIALGKIQPGDSITTPRGEKLSLKPGFDYFAGTFFQGIYQRNRGSGGPLIARNLQDSNESDLRSPAPIELRGSAETSGRSSALLAFWPYLLIACLLLILLEWFLNPRMAGLGFSRKGLRFGQPS
jgi:aerotolerance regulator-like protein